METLVIVIMAIIGLGLFLAVADEADAKTLWMLAAYFAGLGIVIMVAL